MDSINPSDLRGLVGDHKSPCISLYMPTHPVGDAGLQDRIRLKNLLAEAEERLTRRGMRSAEARAPNNEVSTAQLRAPATRRVDARLVCIERNRPRGEGTR